MRYVIWHAPRSGSNLLCNLLHKTGRAGIRDYENCGLFIGHGDIKDAPRKFNDYFANQRTPNGVEGTKASFEYLDNIMPVVGVSPILGLLGTIDKHIYLRRNDKVAQAVSMIFAMASKHFTSIAARERPAQNEPPPYNRAHIAYQIGRLKSYETRFESWFAEMRIRPYYVTYESLASAPAFELAMILHELGVDAQNVDGITPDLQKQSNPIKTAYIERYRRDKTR